MYQWWLKLKQDQTLLPPAYVVPLHQLVWVMCLGITWMSRLSICICAVCVKEAAEREESSVLTISFSGQKKQSPS